MILRLFALLFSAAALVMGFALGWGLPFGELASRINPRAVASLQEGVARFLWFGAWDSLFSPLFAIPAWAVALTVALLLFFVSAMRPGRG